ncbi:MAG TPA: hypothetical protein VIL16_20335 [Trebonia sp.]
MLNAALGWWQADPAAGYVLVCYAARQVWGGLLPGRRLVGAGPVPAWAAVALFVWCS